MRILMISDVYFPRINGVSTSILTFRRQFQEKGHRVTLIAPDYGGSQSDDGDIIRASSRDVYLDPEDRMMKLSKVQRLGGALRSERFDIMHIQTPFTAHYAGVRLAKRLGLPRVESYHTFFEEYLYNYVRCLPKSWMRLAARRFSRWQCNNVDGVVVPSSAMSDRLHDYGVKTPMRVIPTGVELEHFRGGDGARFRRRHGISPQRPVLVHIGRIAFEKNIDFLLEMLQEVRKRIPQVLLILAGEGPAERHLEIKAASLGLSDNVRFVGYLSRQNGLLDCYRAGDAFVFASRTETQGLVLLEAMALGVPVVSTAVMGTRDVLRPDSGAMVAEDDVQDFARKVVTLLGSNRMRGELSATQKSYVKGWSASILADTMLEFYNEVIKACRSPANNARRRALDSATRSR